MFQVLTFEHDAHLVSSCIALLASPGTQLKEYALHLVTVFLIPSIIASSPQPPTRICIWYHTYLPIGFYISLNQHKLCFIGKFHIWPMVNILLFHIFLITIWPSNKTHHKEHPLSFLSLINVKN